MRDDVQSLVKKLRGMELTDEERNLCTGVLLDRLGAIPLRDILYQDTETGTVMVKGEEIDFRMAQDLRNGANAALDNKTFTLIREQVAYEAAVQALAKASSLSDLIFFRAALWWGEQVQKKLEFLAARKELPLSED